MANRTLQVNGQDFIINRDKKADVTQLSVNGSAFSVDRTAPVIDSDPVGNSRPLLGKLVGDAAVAYSLRDLNTKQGDTKAVRVRRESDNEERDFVAKDVSKIADWTNGKLETALPASPDATQTIRIEGGSEVAGVYIARSVVNNKPAYFNESLTVPTKLIFTSGNPRWIIQKQSDNSTLVNSTTTGEDEATPAAITNVATYFSGTGTKLVTSITPHYSAAAAAYSLRKVNSSHGTDIVKLASLDDARIDDLAAEYTSFGDRLTLPSGISIRNFRTSEATTASRTYTNGIVTLSVTSNSALAGGYQSTLRFEDLTPNKRYVIKGETRVIKDTLTGTNPLASARIDINDQYNQVAIYTAANTADWTPFSVVGDTRSSIIVNGANYNNSGRFIDITAQAGGTNITGEVTVQYKNIQIIEDPNYVVRIRRGDNVEADVKFDSNDKLSLNSEVVNTHEDTNASGTSNGVRSRYDYDTGSTTARTLGDFLNESIENFSPVTYPADIDSDYRQWSSLTATSNSFVATTGTVDSNAARYCYALPSSIASFDASGLKLRVSGTVAYTSSGGGGFVIKLSRDANGGNSYSLTNSTLTGAGTISSSNLKFVNGDSGDFVLEFDGNGTLNLRSIVLLQTEVASGTTSISLTNLKFEIIKHGATVNTWYNQATFNEDAYQQAATKQPKIAENGALLADGISFDGTDDFLSTSGVLTSNASASIFTKVTALTADATFTDYFYTEGYLGENGSLNETFGLGWSDSGNINHTSASTELAPNDGLGGSLANGALVSIIGGASTTGSYVNAATVSTVSTPTNASGNNNITTSGGIGGHSGTSSLGKFKMSEILIYASDQSNNRFKIESNINNYFGLYNDELFFSGVVVNTNVQSTILKSDGTTETVAQNGVVSTNRKDAITYTLADSNTGNRFQQFRLNALGDATVSSMANTDKLYVSFVIEEDTTDGLAFTIDVRDGFSPRTNNFQTATKGYHQFSLSRNSTSIDTDLDTCLMIQTSGVANATVNISNIKISLIPRNGFVSTWYDQSGNDNHAVQSSQSKQPTIITNGSIKVSNGSPAIFFTGDARDDSLEFTDLTLTDAAIFTVVNIDSSADQQLILGGSASTATATMIPLLDDGSTSTQVYKNSTVGGAEQGSSQFKNGSALTLADRDDAFDNLAVDSQILFTMIDVDVAEAKVLDGISKCPSNATMFHLQGLMNELIIYNSDQSLNRPAIEANINNQYQIYS